MSGKQIWVVEDEFLVAMEMQFAIEDAGGSVIGPSYSLAAARQTFAALAAPPDAAILDLNLGGEESLPIAESLFDAGIPFLFNTGHGDRADLQDRFGGVRVCIKPTSDDVIIAEVVDLVC